MIETIFSFSFIHTFLAGHNILYGTSQGRYTSTDRKASRIEENRSIDATSCQKKCQKHPECMYFLFFDSNHYQTFKHLTCRLLRSKGLYDKLHPSRESRAWKEF